MEGASGGWVLTSRLDFGEEEEMETKDERKAQSV